jgi:ZIP family zinc transporter
LCRCRSHQRYSGPPLQPPTTTTRNAEGFGIVAPLAGERPSWGFLALIGVIGGAPTFLGTLIGQRLTNDLLSIAFQGLAAGSILYATDAILTAAGA